MTEKVATPILTAAPLPALLAAEEAIHETDKRKDHWGMQKWTVVSVFSRRWKPEVARNGSGLLRRPVQP